jgi:hypothetical protein
MQRYVTAMRFPVRISHVKPLEREENARINLTQKSTKTCSDPQEEKLSKQTCMKKSFEHTKDKKESSGCTYG